MSNPNGENDRTVTCRKFSLTLVSAENLPNVRKVFDNRVETRVTIGGEDSTSEKQTEPDKNNGLNPAWNHRIRYVIAESAITNHDVPLVIKLYSNRKLLKDKYIGEVHRSVKALFEHATAQGGNGSATLDLPITLGSAPTEAVLKISYRFGETIEIEKQAVWKKVLAAGARMALRLVAVATLGIDVKIPIYVEEDIVDAESD